MQLELTEQELGLVFEGLTELPFKRVAQLLSNIESQFKAYKESENKVVEHPRDTPLE